MKRIYLILILITAVYTIKAQNLIAVQHSGSNPAFYTTLDDAVNNAQSGDTIYLPGGAFTVNNNTLTINKELHIIGVGHNPDSTHETNLSRINANTIYLVTGANNSSFEGIDLFGSTSYAAGDIICGTDFSNEDVEYIRISRCHIHSQIILGGFSTNWFVTENIIEQSLRGSHNSNARAQSNYFANNIISGSVQYFGANNQFRNNIFLFYWNGITSYYVMEAPNCIFENNVFLNNNVYLNSSCILNNNLFTYNFNLPIDCIGNNNIINQIQSSIFVNYSGNGFSYTDDYHLQSACLGKNAGTDGTDIGIYGGAFPWKEGSVPHNPHIINKTIGSTTNSNGALPVKITVGAQGN